MIDNPPPTPPAAIVELKLSDSTFTWHQIETADGPRRFMLYVPSGHDGKKRAPLLVVLHGCTQDPENIARGTRFNQLAEERKMLVAYPEQPQKSNSLKCWNWFDQSHQLRDKGEPALIANITRKVMADYKIDTKRVFIAGVSAGGAMALITSYSYPEIFAAAGIHSGIAYGAATTIADALRAMIAGAQDSSTLGALVTKAIASPKSFPAIVFQGEVDKSVKALNSHQIVSQLGALSAGGLKQLADTAAVTPQGYHYTRRIYGAGKKGKPVVEEWTVAELGHAWSGGSTEGTYTDPKGPDAGREMIRFFMEHPRH